MPAPVFESEFNVQFQHVDPAGIVFYPRYVEMLNLSIEYWFERALACSYRELHFDLGLGIPTARLEIDYLAPSELGERLRMQLCVEHLGTSSVRLRHRILCGVEPRIQALQRLVFATLEPLRSTPIPDPIRHRMTAYLSPDEPA